MKKRRSIPFAPIFKDVLFSDAWHNLSHSEQLIYIYIKANHNGSNNGEIPFTYSQVKRSFSSATISKALKGLINKGWLKKTEYGGLFQKKCLYKLTLTYDHIFNA
mgnify:FL=1